MITVSKQCKKFCKIEQILTYPQISDTIEELLETVNNVQTGLNRIFSSSTDVTI